MACFIREILNKERTGQAQRDLGRGWDGLSWIRLDPMGVKPARTGDGCGWGIGTGTEGPLRHGADETVPCPVSGSGSNDAFASERDGRGFQRKAASTDRTGQDRTGRSTYTAISSTVDAWPGGRRCGSWCFDHCGRDLDSVARGWFAWTNGVYRKKIGKGRLPQLRRITMLRRGDQLTRPGRRPVERSRRGLNRRLKEAVCAV